MLNVTAGNLAKRIVVYVHINNFVKLMTYLNYETYLITT